MKILIVDDHPIYRKGLKQLICNTFSNTIIDEATNGNEALNMIKSSVYDIALLDVVIPYKNGLEVLEEAKREFPNLPILILSAHSEEQYGIRAIKSGASGYLEKTGVIDELVEAVKKSLKGEKYITPSLAEKLAYAFEGVYQNKPHENLSIRELQTVQLMAAGISGKNIAKKLSISDKTVSSYRARILEKMDFKSNADIIRYAIENKLI